MASLTIEGALPGSTGKPTPQWVLQFARALAASYPSAPQRHHEAPAPCPGLEARFGRDESELDPIPVTA